MMTIVNTQTIGASSILWIPLSWRVQPQVSMTIAYSLGVSKCGAGWIRNFAQPQWRCIDPRRVSARRLKWAGGRRAEGNSVDGETAGEPKMGRGTTRSPQEKKGGATA